MHGYTEEQKTLVGISTISVVTRLAMEFQQEEVRRHAIHPRGYIAGSEYRAGQLGYSAHCFDAFATPAICRAGR